MSKKYNLVLLALGIPAVLLIAWWLYGVLEGWRLASMPRSACQFPFALSDAAEKKPGGALYEGAIPQTEKDMAAIPQMDGAHHIHAAQYGGEIFMSKNKINHLETVYSDACGLRVIFYNAFTEPVRADRFQAVALLIPDGDGRPYDGVVFLQPSADGQMLQAWIHQDTRELIGAEVHFKYPGLGEPEMFDVYLGDIGEALGN
ncbi:MAG: hypothetical protein HQ513_09840 [Rhodospirillales bacterium]|nr:hypothetical protein [Rhodospirillales bacterium]